jgi:hypothetical protein
MRLMEQVAETVVAFARASGPVFLQVFVQLLPHIHEYLQPSKKVSERSMATGMLAELIEVLGDDLASHAEAILGLLRMSLTDKEPEVVSNGAYALGQLCQRGGEAMFPFYESALTLLHAHCLTSAHRNVSTRVFFLSFFLFSGCLSKSAL